MSELCYKAIALDSIEDKKHIDLSAEPLIIVCAPSVSGPNARDIAKEIDIFRAHKAAPVVIAAEGSEELFNSGRGRAWRPPVPPRARIRPGRHGRPSIRLRGRPVDRRPGPARCERPGRCSRAPPRHAGGGPDLDELAPALRTASRRRRWPALRSGAYDGHLNASTAARLTSLLRYATGALPVEGYEAEMGKVGVPERHRGRPRRGPRRRHRRADPAHRRHQSTRPRRSPSASRGARTRSSAPGWWPRRCAPEPPSRRSATGRCARWPLSGRPSKRSSVTPATMSPCRPSPALGAGQPGGRDHKRGRPGRDRHVAYRRARLRTTACGARSTGPPTRGRSPCSEGLHDGRTGVMVPEVKDGQVTGITLLHARFVARARPRARPRPSCRPYQGRYTALVDAVTEGRAPFRRRSCSGKSR